MLSSELLVRFLVAGAGFSRAKDLRRKTKGAGEADSIEAQR